MARILLTEDDESVRAFVKRALELDGHEITEAEDGGIALEILTARRGEFELLLVFARHPGRVLTREQLLSEVWGYDYFGGTRTVDVHIRRLRAKLGPEFDSCIGTVRNVGYRFAVDRQS